MKKKIIILVFAIIWVDIHPAYPQNGNTDIFSSYCQLGSDAEGIEDYNTALFWYNKAKEYAIEQFGENDLLVATSLSVIGELQIKSGAQEEGIKSLQQCVAISAEYPSNLPQLHSDYIERLGSGYFACGDYQNAIYYFKTALEYLSRGKKTPMYADRETEAVLFASRQCRIYHDLAKAYEEVGNCSTALKYYETAKTVIEKTLAENMPAIRETDLQTYMGSVNYNSLSFIDSQCLTLYSIYKFCLWGISGIYMDMSQMYIGENDYKMAAKYYELAVDHCLNHPFVCYNLDRTVLEYVVENSDNKKAMSYIDKYAQILINDTGRAAELGGDDIESLYHTVSINLWTVSQLYDKRGLAAKSYEYSLSRLRLFEDAGIINQDYANAIEDMANWMQTTKQEFISALDWHQKHVEVVASLCNNDIYAPELCAAIERMAACYGSCSRALEVNGDYDTLLPLICKWENALAQMYTKLGRDVIDSVLYDTHESIFSALYVGSIYPNYCFWHCDSLLATKLYKIRLYIKLHEIDAADEVCRELEELLRNDKRYDLLSAGAFSQIIDDYIHESYYVRAKDLAEYTLYTLLYQNKDDSVKRIKRSLSEHIRSQLGLIYIRLGDVMSAYEIIALSRPLVHYTHATITDDEDFIKGWYEDIENYISDNHSLRLLYEQWGDYEVALYHEKCAYNAVEKDESSKSLSEEMSSLSSLGYIYIALKKYDEAEDCLKRAIDIYETHYKDNIVDVWPMSIYMHLGHLYFNKQDFATAKEILYKVYNYCEKNKPNELDAPASYLAEIYRQEDNYIEAKKYFTISWESFIESAQVQLKTMTSYERSLFWGKYRCFMELYGGQAISATPYYDDIYYNILLHWKNLLLRTDLDIDLFVRNSHSYDLKELYLRMRRETDPQRKSGYEKEFAYLISSLYPDNNIIEWQDVQKALKKKEVAIEFAECWQKDSKQYAALILRKDWDAPKMVVLCDDNELTSLVKLNPENKRWRNSNAGTKKLIQQYYEKGYQLIWSKLEPYINNGDEVYFSPSGLLYQMNVEVLRDESGRLANEKYNLHRVSSTRELCIQRAKTKLNAAVLYGGLQYDMDSTAMMAQHRAYSHSYTDVAARGFVADSTSRGIKWDYLEGTMEEVSQIKENLSQKHISVTSYMAQAGTEESFKALSGKKTPMIHLATHGFFYTNERAQRESYFEMLNADQTSVRLDNSLKRSGLLLAGAQLAWDGKEVPANVEDGILLAEEIATMDLSGTELVVLSACETGLGEITSEGVFGLQRAFKKAGVQTLIMSLWKVDDAATKLMMTTFYNEWFSGKPKHEAFVTAQRKVRNEYNNPYYWASFIMLD